MKLNIDVKVNTTKLAKEFEALKDDNVMYEIHDLFADMCYPYVPMQEGVLSDSVKVDKEKIHYDGPYAHYMYVGEVYGPNYPIYEGGDVEGFFTNPYGKKSPIIKNGIIVGWYSPPHKHPMGRDISFDKEKHKLASKEWDKAMMRDNGDVFLNAVKNILMQRFKELYG